MKKGSFKLIVERLCTVLLTLLTPHPVVNQVPPLPEAARTLLDAAQPLERNVSGVVYHPVRLDRVQWFEVATVGSPW